MTSAIDTAPARLSGLVAPGHVLGRYELLMPIAAGGMAMVWAARLKGTRGFQKIVAVKTMLPKLSDEIQFEQMFLDEASLASQVRHPHVVEILDLGEQDGVLFLVMEWIDGMPLNQLMKAAKTSGGMPMPVAVRIVMQACAGLHAAHELRDSKGQLVGLVHRDVSPQNILVTYDGVTKVVDFGVAKATATGGGATSAGQIKGKVGYMAPEQIEGEETMDRRADIFAIGIVLYALTTGKHPFRRESDAATMYNICSPQAAVSPRKIIPDYPPAVERIVLKALAKNPADRYDTANEMLKDLDQALPSDQRANTDEDLAHFVRKLLGDKLQERRATLSDALTRADLNAQSAVIRMPDGSAPLGSSLTATGLPVSMLPADATATQPTGLARRSSWKIAVGAVLLTSLALVAGFFAAQSPSDTPRPSAEQAPQVAPTAQAPVATAAPAPTTAPEPALPASATRAATPPPRAVAPPSYPAAPAKPPAPKNNWRHDPGF